MSIARDAKRHARTMASRSNAEMIFEIIRGEPTPRDAAATLSAVHAALIWQLEQADEEKVRKLLQESVDGTLELWRANRKFYDEQNKKGMQ